MAEVDGHRPDHAREGSRESFDEPEPNPHHMRLRIGELAGPVIQVLGTDLRGCRHRNDLLAPAPGWQGHLRSPTRI